MVELKGVAHFSLAVSDIKRSIKFYTDIVGCKHLTTVGGKMAFLDAAGVCLILVERKPPINSIQDNHNGVHHAFIVDGAEGYRKALDHLRANGIEITFEEDRQGGTVNGPRAYFRDPDGTVLEFINLTKYDTTSRPSA
jgi:catechol 2,3-dioxygenase-like lactoylglutathione lyase family enzyme